MSEVEIPKCSICSGAVSDCWGQHARVPRYLRPELKALDDEARERRIAKAVAEALKAAERSAEVAA